jgi:hypothetical protein
MLWAGQFKNHKIAMPTSIPEKQASKSFLISN